MTAETGRSAGKPADGSRAGRRPLVAANWKMNKTNAEAREFMREFLPAAQGRTAAVDLVVCPPYPALHTVTELARDSGVLVGAQNMHVPVGTVELIRSPGEAQSTSGPVHE